MSAREWKPGDVAMRQGAYEQMVGLFVEGCPAEHGFTNDWSTTPHWHYQNGGWSPADTETEHRPLVVIDPEDREQMERLLDAHNEAEQEAACKGGECGSGSCWIDIMRGTFRIFANPKPPKPEEPTGLGAVVEDENGMTWFRWHSPGYDELHPAQDRPWSARNGMGSDRRYDELTVVRVLSEGVQP